MANNKTIEINVKINGLDTIKGQVEDLKSQLEEIGDIELISDEAGNKITKITKNVDNLGKAAKKSSTSIKDIAKGFGLMKAGEAILGKISNLFSENAVVGRAFEIGTRALSIVFKDFFNFISDNIGSVIQGFKDVFENPTESIENFAFIIDNVLIKIIGKTLELLGDLASGVGDLLTGDFKGAIEEFNKAGKIITDTGDAIAETYNNTTKALGEAYDATKKYITASVDLATVQIDQENRAKILSAQSKIRAELLDREAEKLRQIIGDTQLSVQARIDANNKLKGVLEKLQTARIAQADAEVLVAQNAFNLNKSTENQVRLLQALGEKTENAADAEVAFTEQRTQGASLQKELITLNQTAIKGLSQREQAEKDFTASQIIDITDRLDAQKNALIETQKIEEAEINEIINNSAKGTQARADAEQAILASRQKLTQDLITNEKDKNKQLETEHQQHLTNIIEADVYDFENKFAALDEELALINAKTFESEEAKTKAVKENSDKRTALRKAEIDVELEYLSAASSVASSLGEISKEGGDVQKAFAVSSAIIDTYVAIAGTLANVAKTPAGAIPGYAIAQAVATGIFGLLQVKKIMSVKPGQTKSASGGGGGATLQPSFNLIGQNNNKNNINEGKTTEVSDKGQIIVKAYVSETEITQKQGFIKKVGESAKI